MRDHIIRDKLIYKCFACNKNGHMTKNCNSKAKLRTKCDIANCPGNCSKANWKCDNCGGNHSAVYKESFSYKSAISKSLDIEQNISYAQTVCRRGAKKGIEVFKANMIINLPQSIRIITIVIKEIDREDSNFIDQLANRVSD